MNSEKTFGDIVVEQLESDVDLSDAELQQMIQIDLENLVNTYASKKIPAILTLLHLQALVEYSVKELSVYFGDLMTNPEKVAKDVKEVFNMSDVECKKIEKNLSKKLVK